MKAGKTDAKSTVEDWDNVPLARAVKIAVVGPRQGADTGAVYQFCLELHAKDPTIILLSGGAKGVDQTAELIWSQAGGRVWSYRISQQGPESFYAVKWEYGGPLPPKRYLLQGEPEWLNAKSALLYRSILIADEADRVVGFEGRLSMRGTEFTLTYAKDRGKPVHVWREGAWR